MSEEQAMPPRPPQTSEPSSGATRLPVSPPLPTRREIAEKIRRERGEHGPSRQTRILAAVGALLIPFAFAALGTVLVRFIAWLALSPLQPGDLMVGAICGSAVGLVAGVIFFIAVGTE